jgi:branched-chain amino acid transport system ATP-binding protein
LVRDAILKVNGLNCCYGLVCALKGIDFYARSGEIVGIIGPNGAGKTTLLESIAGSHRITRGTIELDGYRIEHLAVIKRRRLGLMLIPQERNIFPLMSVRKNLDVGAKESDKGERKRLLDYVFNLFPILWDKRKDIACTLSGGQQKMLAVGIGIASNARILLIDEPSIGLAPKLVTRLFETFGKIRDDTGRTVVLAEQNIKILNIADRLFGLEAGEIKFDEQTKNLSREVVTNLYLGNAG